MENTTERKTITTDPLELDELFYRNLVKQVRATDAYGSYAKYNDDDLVRMKYVKAVESAPGQAPQPARSELKNEQVALNIKMYLQAVCVTLEKITGQITSLMTEAGCDGSVQALVYTGDLIIMNKTFGGIGGFQYGSLDKLKESGRKLLEKLHEAVKTKTGKYEAFLAAV